MGNDEAKVNDVELNQTNKTNDDSSDDDNNDKNDNSDSDSDINVKLDEEDDQIKKISYIDFLRSKMKKTIVDSDDDEIVEKVEETKKITKKKVVIIKVVEEDLKKSIENELKPDLTEDLTENGRLFVRNISYSVVESELTELFEKFGPVSDIHIPIDKNNDKKGKGYAFIQYMFPENALKAMKSLDGTSFQGRLLHIIIAQNPKEKDELVNPNKMKLSSFQLKKEENRLKLLNDKNGWNSSYVRFDRFGTVLLFLIPHWSNIWNQTKPN